MIFWKTIFGYFCFGFLTEYGSTFDRVLLRLKTCSGIWIVTRFGVPVNRSVIRGFASGFGCGYGSETLRNKKKKNLWKMANLTKSYLTLKWLKLVIFRKIWSKCNLNHECLMALDIIFHSVILQSFQDGKTKGHKI